MKNLFYLIFFCTIPMISQTIGNGDGISTDIQAGIVMREVDIQGSPYLNEVYKKGETIINGKSRTSALMRYDAYHDAVEILDENRKARKLLRRPSIKAVFDGKTYEVLEYKERKQVKMGYFNPLNQGHTQLLFKPKKKFIQAEKPENGYDEYDPPVYKDISAYFIRKGDQSATIIKLNKKGLLKALNDQEALLKKFIKKHSLDLKKETHAIRLIQYYNSINKTTEKSIDLNSTAVG